MEQRSQLALEFDKIKAYLSQLTLSPLGTRHVEMLEVGTDLPQVEIRLSEVTELKEIRALHGHLPLHGLADIRPALAQARVQGEILAPLDLRHIYTALRTGRATQQFIMAIEPPGYPHIRSKVEQIVTVEPVETAVRRAIDEEGEILDGASPKLKQIRRDLQHTRAKIQTWLQNFLQRQDNQSILQDQVITSRHDRYVIPVKASSRGKVKGIVHDSSASGVTVYVEPLETVELNNQIATLEAEEKQEIRRILLELTDLVRAHLPAIHGTLDVLGELDFINAKARLSEQWQGHQPQLSQERCIRLLQARHPLLLIQHGNDLQQVVPINVRLTPEETTLLITGPNTGGKTVSLKTIGLLAFMVQAGLHIPAAVDSEIGVFEHIFADIGDQQSIEQNLSTFSSHISHIVEILANVTPRSLILLDELGAGTDPAEGASLGIAILEYLDQVGAICIATTHHDALKAYAYTHPRTINACVEFDVNTLSPTYRLIFGLPGKSNAYIIAERLGMPAALLQRAKALMSDDLHKVDHLIQKLTTESQQIEKQKFEVETRLRGVTRLEHETDRLLAMAEEERQDILHKALDEAKQIVAQALSRSQEVLAKLPAATREEGKTLIKTLHQEATIVQQKVQQIKKTAEPVPAALPGEIMPGQQVRISGFGQTGTVLTLSKDGQQADVQVGAMTLQVSIAQLTPIAAPNAAARPQKISVSEISASDDYGVLPELVLVGKRVEDALEEVDKYLDQAVLSGYASVTIVHGVGTGKLKQAVSALLRSHPHVTSYKAAEENQAMTIAYLTQR